MSSEKTEVGILGATGMVGQHFIRFLQGHPWFEVKWLGASDRSVGKKYRDATSWRLDGDMPDAVASIRIGECTPGSAPQVLFSALDAGVALEIERAFAEAGHSVISNARNHRMDSAVPLLVPEVNPDHLGLLPLQKRRYGWSGQIVTNPNCSTVMLAMVLAPLRRFGITRVVATTMQALSGAGFPGVASVDINGNVIPFIGGEEEKIEQETQKILGTWNGDVILPLPAKVSAHCNRVPVLDGHTVTVSVEFSSRPAENDVRSSLEAFTGAPQQRNLPSAPECPLIYLPQCDRPQPRRDVERGNGMVVSAGRLRLCPVLHWKFVALGHNAIRGAAGAAVLNAELMYSEGLLGR